MWCPSFPTEVEVRTHSSWVSKFWNVSLESGAHLGLSLVDVSPGHRAAVLGDCYRYSSSRAWCRAMRSEWLETLQKGMACCGGGQTMWWGWRTLPAPAVRAALSVPSMHGPTPFIPNCENCPLRSQHHICLKQKSKLTPPLRIPVCVLKCNSGVCFFLRGWWVFLKQTYTATWMPTPNFK